MGAALASCCVEKVHKRDTEREASRLRMYGNSETWGLKPFIPTAEDSVAHDLVSQKSCVKQIFSIVLANLTCRLRREWMRMEEPVVVVAMQLQEELFKLRLQAGNQMPEL